MISQKCHEMIQDSLQYMTFLDSKRLETHREVIRLCRALDIARQEHKKLVAETMETTQPLT